MGFQKTRKGLAHLSRFQLEERDHRALRLLVDQRLDELSPRGLGSEALDDAVRHALLTPGKRIRPLLTMLAARELGTNETGALDAGCALEMVHAASLVLDDLPCMDDAASRRGEPATHVAFGQDVAVLASVTLLARAFATLSSAPGLAPEQRTSLVSILAEAVGSEGLAGGQYRDLRGGDGQGGIDGASEANRRKTGTLFLAATDMASVIAGADVARTAPLRRFAEHLGQAFQILDDLEDGPSKAEVGRPGGFEDAGRANILTFLGTDGARRRLDAHLANVHDALQPGGDLAIFVRTIFDGHRSTSLQAAPIFQAQA